MGKLLIFTGDGKGKSTAAFGMAVRFLGHGKKVCIVQFIKSAGFETGELNFFKKIGVEIIPCGCGLTNRNSAEKNREYLRVAYDTAICKLKGNYNLVVLDEINNVFNITAFETEDVCPPDILLNEILAAAENKDVVLTGRGAPQKYIDAAHLVTEMKPVKHYYNSNTPAQKGLEY
ncbi:MAG: cob(I)yrinic acid a,c-diamide adenosyltransferase [Clostridiales bacterium]|jgi:cob(I)alamin adenosyltransferase|nr:cob(I)yrinic acid a,c-diamide adenosyltransferase [Clostridiales bacterium]